MGRGIKRMPPMNVVMPKMKKSQWKPPGFFNGNRFACAVMFTKKELSILDALTADNEVVLASLGGKPEMPEQKNEDPYDEAEEGNRTGTARRRVANS